MAKLNMLDGLKLGNSLRILSQTFAHFFTNYPTLLTHFSMFWVKGNLFIVYEHVVQLGNLMVILSHTPEHTLTHFGLFWAKFNMVVGLKHVLKHEKSVAILSHTIQHSSYIFHTLWSSTCQESSRKSQACSPDRGSAKLTLESKVKIDKPRKP